MHSKALFYDSLLSQGKEMASRYHQRFAVQQHVTLDEGGEGGLSGLLFELSQAGCRISNLGRRCFRHDESVRINVPGFGPLEGQVRAASEGAVALRYNRPLGAAVLESLIRACRAQGEAPAAA
jgi:hypothetical protein